MRVCVFTRGTTPRDRGHFFFLFFFPTSPFRSVDCVFSFISLRFLCLVSTFCVALLCFQNIEKARERRTFDTMPGSTSTGVPEDLLAHSEVGTA